jgi:hypothetical protein
MIGQLTGDSVDWLLGFDDISQRRLDRAPVAHVGDDLRRILEQTASDIQTEESALIKAIAERDSVPLPVPRWRKRLNPLPESPSDLVALLAKGWWDREIMTQAVRWRDTLRELAAKMRADSASAEEAYLQEVLLRTSDRIYYDADHLDSTDAFLRKVDALESEGPLPNVNRPTSLDSIGVAFSLTLETDFPVLANRLNYGVAYRGKKRDRVWYIDTDLHVSVREHGRCLVERKKEPGLLSNLLRNVGINAADGPLYRTSSPKVGPQSIQSLLEGAAGSATPVTPASTEMLNTAPKRKRAGTSTKAPRTQRYKLTAVPSKKRNKGRDRT